MTPAYIWGEMDMAEVREAIGFVVRSELHPVSKEHYQHMVKELENWLAPPAERERQDLSWIKPPIGRVIHGR